jgi:hypothetical protein
MILLRKRNEREKENILARTDQKEEAGINKKKKKKKEVAS